MNIRLLMASFTFSIVLCGGAYAGDKICDTIKSPTSRASCNCAVSNGGTSKITMSGQISWMRPKGLPLAYSQCLAAIGH